jgi:uncharacterized protein (TIGR00661 family)
MKILYGVVGEGMGHAMRSRVVLEHLIAQGHDVHVMASGRAVDFLSKRFPNVNRIHGLHMIYEENRVRRGKTLWSNVLGGVTGVPQNIKAYFELVDDFRPNVVISDFESWTYLYAKSHRLPVLSIDNMQIINRCTHPEDVTRGHETEFQLTKTFVKGKLPFCDEYLITTFFRPPVRKPDTFLVPPILRPEVLEARRSEGKHLLVYQTGEGYQSMFETLSKSGIECRIYGARRNITEDQREGTLVYRAFSEKGFIDDMASALGVIAGGGFTTMGEAVYLQKPMLSVPLGLQFEQVMNARYLEHEGFGMMCESLDDPAVIHRFIDNLPKYAKKLSGYAQDGNKETFAKVDEFLDRAAVKGVL